MLFEGDSWGWRNMGQANSTSVLNEHISDRKGGPRFEATGRRDRAVGGNKPEVAGNGPQIEDALHVREQQCRAPDRN